MSREVFLKNSKFIMGRNVIVITVDGNKYKVEKNGISDFALIGVLECVAADLKRISRQNEGSLNREVEMIEPKDIAGGANSVVQDDMKSESAEAGYPGISSKANEPIVAPPDLKSRIIKAREAIRGLNGEVDNTDLSKMSDEELQEEFDALTAQYKRLKSSGQGKKR